VRLPRSFLRARVREGSVLPAVEGIDYMLNLGVDPTMQLKLHRSQLENLRTEMENAVRCDVDLGGVRIARLIHRAAGGRAIPVLMDGSVVREARITCPLTRGQRESIVHDLALHPDALLSETLKVLLERGVWVEQESLIDRPATLPI
jgi:hypothetical protein